MRTKQLHISKNGDVEVEFVNSPELEAYDGLAREALAECRASLTMAARYLNAALWRLPLERAPLSRTLSAGPRVLRYDPENVVDSYREGEHELVRDCLHALLHCVFHHIFDRRHEEFDTWSLACDIAVEACAIDLCGTRFPSTLDQRRVEATRGLREKARNLTAPALYQVLRHGQPGERLYSAYGLTGENIDFFRDLFTRDAHDLWAGRPHTFGQDEPQGSVASIPDLQARGEGETLEAPDDRLAPDSGVPEAPDGGQLSATPDDGSPEAPDGESPEALDDDPLVVSDDGSIGLPGDDPLAAPSDGQQSSPCYPERSEGSPQRSGGDDPRDDLTSDDEEALAEWRKVSKQVAAELRMQRTRATGGDGTMLQNLSVATKKPADYEGFLKRFATLSEDMRVNDDEFDYIFYTYGIGRYGNVPLVEPLEYVESNRVREFVIAIDTSGSCSGELVREFVQRTYDILRTRTSFGDEVNVHIVQCDKEVRSATKVTSLRQLEEYAESFWVSGGGGTDFRPVFSYVDSLIEEGEFNDLRGLVYFTDGYGTFPTRPPDYDVAFVFVDAEGMDVRVPPWAMKVVMSQDEIMQETGPREQVPRWRR